MSPDGAAESGPSGLTRRGALGGVAAVVGAVTGFPTVWAQEIRDVRLVHVGPAHAAILDVARQASKDLGFTVEVQNAEGDALVDRVVDDPGSLDVAGLEFWAVRRAFPRGVVQPVPVAAVGPSWDKVAPIFTQGRYPDGREVPAQGALPYEVQYAAGADSAEFAPGPTDHVATVPFLCGADTLGLRPDVAGRPVERWADLLDPALAGRTALVDVPSIGIMDAAMAIESRGDIAYGDKGNMTAAEIDATIEILADLKRRGHFRAFWATLEESVELMASGEVVLQSMWSPAVAAVRARGVACAYQPLKEGYRGWGAGLCLMGHLEGLKRDAAREYLAWHLSGWPGAFVTRQGYYSAAPETARPHLSLGEWAYWCEGLPAAVEIRDPYGALAAEPGARRDGGGLWDRMGRIACWDTVMDENRYLTSRWRELVAG